MTIFFFKLKKLNLFIIFEIVIKLKYFYKLHSRKPFFKNIDLPLSF